MTLPRLLTATVLAAALASGPALSSHAFAQASKSRAARSKAKAAPAPAADAAPAAPTEAAPPAAPEQQILTSNPAATIPAVLQASGKFTNLLKAAQATNLTGVLGGPRAITLFAPTDEAFANISPGELQALLKPENADTLQKILTYHVIATKLPAAQIRGKQPAAVPTAGGANVVINGLGPSIKYGDATVVQSDVQASNGVIYVIDKVILPPGLKLPATAADPSSLVPGSAPGSSAVAPQPR